MELEIKKYKPLDPREYMSYGKWEKTLDDNIDVFQTRKNHRIISEKPLLINLAGYDETELEKIFSAKSLTQTLFYTRIRNAIILPRPTGLPRNWGFFSPDSYISLSLNQVAKDKYTEQGVLSFDKDNAITPTNIISPKMKLSGQWFWTVNFDNWYHTIFETIAGIPDIKKLGVKRSDSNHLIQTSVKPLDETMSLLGIHHRQIISYSNIPVEVEELIIASNLFSGHIEYPTQAPLEIAKSFVTKVKKVNLKTQSPKKIFVSRKNASVRKISNEDLLSNYLGLRGFTTIDPGDYTKAEQVKLFSEAEVIIGPHGQGLTNMIFAENLKLLVEIHSSKWVRNYYYRPSQLMEIKYVGIICPSDDAGNITIDDNFMRELSSLGF